MKSRNENIRFLMGVASAQEQEKRGFAIAYQDDFGVCYVNERGEPLSEVPAGMTVIHARNKEQSELWVTFPYKLYKDRPPYFRLWNAIFPCEFGSMQNINSCLCS